MNSDTLMSKGSKIDNKKICNTIVLLLTETISEKYGYVIEDNYVYEISMNILSEIMDDDMYYSTLYLCIRVLDEIRDRYNFGYKEMIECIPNINEKLQEYKNITDSYINKNYIEEDLSDYEYSSYDLAKKEVESEIIRSMEYDSELYRLDLLSDCGIKVAVYADEYEGITNLIEECISNGIFDIEDIMVSIFAKFNYLFEPQESCFDEINSLTDERDKYTLIKELISNRDSECDVSYISPIKFSAEILNSVENNSYLKANLKNIHLKNVISKRIKHNA